MWRGRRLSLREKGEDGLLSGGGSHFRFGLLCCVSEMFRAMPQLSSSMYSFFLSSSILRYSPRVSSLSLTSKSMKSSQSFSSVSGCLKRLVGAFFPRPIPSQLSTILLRSSSIRAPSIPCTFHSFVTSLIFGRRRFVIGLVSNKNYPDHESSIQFSSLQIPPERRPSHSPRPSPWPSWNGRVPAWLNRRLRPTGDRGFVCPREASHCSCLQVLRVASSVVSTLRSTLRIRLSPSCETRTLPPSLGGTIRWMERFRGD